MIKANKANKEKINKEKNNNILEEMKIPRCYPNIGNKKDHEYGWILKIYK